MFNGHVWVSKFFLIPIQPITHIGWQHQLSKDRQDPDAAAWLMICRSHDDPTQMLNVVLQFAKL